MTKRGKHSSNRRDDGFRGSTRNNLVAQQIRQEYSFDFADWMDFEVSEDDLRNFFAIKVRFPQLDDVSLRGKSYNMFGRQTVGELADKVAYRLWIEDKIFSPQSELSLYRLDGKLLVKDELLAAVLNDNIRERLWDGKFLRLRCRVNGIWGEAEGC